VIAVLFKRELEKIDDTHTYGNVNISKAKQNEKVCLLSERNPS